MKTIKLKVSHEDIRPMAAAIAASGYPTWVEDEAVEVQGPGIYTVEEHVCFNVPDEAVETNKR